MPQQSLLPIITSSSQSYTLLSTILRHYFPSQQKQLIHISNKYYTADIQLANILWSQVLTSSQEIKEQEQQTKIDFLIMVVQQHQHFDYKSIDDLIDRHNPQEFVLLVNTKNKDSIYKYEDDIVQNCNNFVEIVKENLDQLGKTLPKWNRGHLLGNDEEPEDQTGIFSILDRMETARWSTMFRVEKTNTNKGKEIKENVQMGKIEQRKQVQSKDIKKIEINQEKSQKITQNLKQVTQITQTTDIKPQPTQPNPQTLQKPIQPTLKPQFPTITHQPTQYQLQSQTQQFQSMLSQMMQFKQQSTSMKDSERKVKAQELFMKMFQGMGLDME